MTRRPNGSASISSISWLAVSDQLSDIVMSANGWPFLSSWTPAAPGVLMSVSTIIGQ